MPSSWLGIVPKNDSLLDKNFSIYTDFVNASPKIIAHS